MGCIVLGTSQVPGEPRLSVCTCSNPTPAGLLAPDHCSAATWPLKAQAQRLPRLVYRRSIAWLSDSLRAPCAAWSASQCGLLQHHARLASSCWSGSTGRAFHPHGSAEKFQSCQLHLIPLSQAFLTQWAVTEAVWRKSWRAQDDNILLHSPFETAVLPIAPLRSDLLPRLGHLQFRCIGTTVAA